MLNDGCSNCVKDYGFVCSGAEPDVCASVCGDGKKAFNELCDDGNNLPNDGCFLCSFETNSICNTLVDPN